MRPTLERVMEEMKELSPGELQQLRALIDSPLVEQP